MLAAPPELALHDFIKQKQSQTTHAQTGTGATPGKRKLTGAEVIKQHQDSVQARVRTAEMTNWTQGCLNLASPDTRLSVPAQVHSSVTFWGLWKIHRCQYNLELNGWF